jgi:Fic-DOC domain mobile mystery protein B
MGLKLYYIDGQTPLDEEEKEGLLIKTITNHSELDEHEQLNIERAVEWILSNKFHQEKILSEEFIKKLHKKMFDKVWKWAGEFRKTEKNIGVSWINIGIELRYLLDDTKYWIQHRTYSPDEIAIRFKHRLVKIHCFSNGNGRHSRIMADIIIESVFGKNVFIWHNSNMAKPDETRKKYIEALIEADNGNINPLIEFARK